MARIPQDESRKVHRAIVGAAVEELASCGFQGLRIPAVARRVGKTQGAVYGRFPDKEALTLAALRYTRDQVLMPRIVATMSEEGSALDKIERVSATVAEFATKNRAGERSLTRLAVELGDDRGPVGKEVRAFINAFVEVIEGLLSQAQADGEIRADVDVKQVAHVAVSAQIGMSTMAAMFRRRTSYRSLEAALRPILTRGVQDEIA